MSRRCRRGETTHQIELHREYTNAGQSLPACSRKLSRQLGKHTLYVSISIMDCKYICGVLGGSRGANGPSLIRALKSIREEYRPYLSFHSLPCKANSSLLFNCISHKKWLRNDLCVQLCFRIVLNMYLCVCMWSLFLWITALLTGTRTNHRHLVGLLESARTNTQTELWGRAISRLAGGWS